MMTPRANSVRDMSCGLRAWNWVQQVLPEHPAEQYRCSFQPPPSHRHWWVPSGPHCRSPERQSPGDTQSAFLQTRLMRWQSSVVCHAPLRHLSTRVPSGLHRASPSSKHIKKIGHPGHKYFLLALTGFAPMLPRPKRGVLGF